MWLLRGSQLSPGSQGAPLHPKLLRWWNLKVNWTGARSGVGIVKDGDPTASLGCCNILPCTQRKKSFLTPTRNFP